MALFATAVLRLVWSVSILAQPAEVMLGEGILYGHVVSLARGEQLYRPVDQAPYTLANYTPLYYVAGSALHALAGGGFGQCHNAQAVVTAGSLLVVATDVVQAPNDKQQLTPMLGQLAGLPRALGKAETLPADGGYFSAADVQACEAAGLEPLIALAREGHHPTLEERFAVPPPQPDGSTPVAAMAHRLRTPEGRALYAQRKHTPEPVFGIIKSVLGFRQFLLRGLDAVRGEWRLVTMAWNLKRMFALNLAT